MFWNRLNCWKTIAQRSLTAPNVALVGVVDRPAVDDDAAAIWAQQTNQHAEKGAFARSRRADDADHLGASDRQRHPAQHGLAAIGGSEVSDVEIRQVVPPIADPAASMDMTAQSRGAGSSRRTGSVRSPGCSVPAQHR